MKRLLASALGLLLTITIAHAHSTETSTGLIIEHPWARPSIPGSNVTAGYLVINNTGENSEFLMGAVVDGVGMVEIHDMVMDGDIMRMTKLSDPLEIAPGETLTLKPHSFHLMFMNVTEPFVEEASVNGTLIFKVAGNVDVVFNIEAPSPATQMSDMTMNMDKESHSDHDRGSME